MNETGTSVSLLLASKSAARRAMLEAAGVPFATIDAPFDEDLVKQDLRGRGMSAARLAVALAEAKALAAEAPSALVLGADQTLEQADGSMLDKPASRANALEQLGHLSGTSHRLHSAAAVALDGKIIWSASETVTLTMRPLSPEFLEAYLDHEYERIRWSVGGYHVEGRGVQLFEEIEGSHFAILGLPLLPLLDFLRAQRIILA